MFPASDMFIKAEMEYKREQALKGIRPRARRRRREHPYRLHLLPSRSQGVRTA